MAADAADAAPTAPMDVDPPPSAPEPPAASIDRAVLAARRRRSEMVQQCLPHHNAKIITRFIRLHVAWKRGLELIRREASSDDDSGDDSDDNASSAPDRTARLVRLELPHGPSNSDIAVAAHTMSLRTRRTDTRTPRRIPVASRRGGDAVAMDTEDLPPDEEAPEEEMEDMTAVARNAGVTNDAAETARALDALHIAADAEAELTQTRYLERHWRQQESILQGIPFPMLEELRRNRTVANYPGHMRKGRVAMDEGIELLNRMWRGSTHG